MASSGRNRRIRRAPEVAMKMTERSARWMKSVLSNCTKNTGRSLDQWLALARRAKVPDAKAARDWANQQGLSIVYATAVADALFPLEPAGEDRLIDAQYSGPKAGLRSVFDALTKALTGLGRDVEVMPRKSQVTFSRAKSFVVVRAATKDRVDVALKLHGTAASPRLVTNPKATTSDPSHTVAVRTPKEVDRELLGWMRAAYDRAGR
jgi:hypothetical protein